MSTKEEDVARLQVRLNELNAEINRITQKIDGGEEVDKSQFLEMRADLFRLRSAANAKLTELVREGRTEEESSELESDIERAWDNLEDAVKAATARVFD